MFYELAGNAGFDSTRKKKTVEKLIDQVVILDQSRRVSAV